MADEPVSTLDDVGPKRAAFLRSLGFETVGQLAKLKFAEAAKLKIRPAWITQAKLKVKLSGEEPEEPAPKATMALAVPSLEQKEPVTGDQADGPAIADERHLISNHPWQYMRVLVPVADSRGKVEQREVIIGELSVEPFNRVSFICEWNDVRHGADQLCEMTFTPQFIFFFNRHLPIFGSTIEMSQEDLDAMPNKEAIFNQFNELGLMQLVEQRSTQFG